MKIRKKETIHFTRILNKRSLMVFTLFVVISTIIWIAPLFPMKDVVAKKSKSSKLGGLFGGSSSSSSDSGGRGGRSLTQIPSENTDFPGNDQNVIQVSVTSAKKDIIGDYHVRGEIKNLSNDTLQFVKVTAHFLDAANQPIGVTSCCYADPSDIEPGHTSTFDSFSSKDEISGTPVSYRLSFDWQ